MSRAELYHYHQDNGVADVAEMHVKYGLTYNLQLERLHPMMMKRRANFLREELDEFRDAIEHDDLEGMIDALIDLVFVAKGTAVMMGMRWQPHWNEVVRANMSKVRGPDREDRGENLLKPEGWVAPDHRKVFENYGS
jgi:predicted HAD superfamily Cof-like phosphohydrolase